MGADADDVGDEEGQSKKGRRELWIDTKQSTLHTAHTLRTDRLGVPASRSIVVEDSLIGLQAALGAEMPCVITYTPSTKSQDFSGAKAIYPELGDAPNVRVRVGDLMELALGSSSDKRVVGT